ncbi:UNVERIFIED_CONTAM: hypothetical protein K2H54_026838 [Gekko kuhli]
MKELHESLHGKTLLEVTHPCNLKQNGSLNWSNQKSRTPFTDPAGKSYQTSVVNEVSLKPSLWPPDISSEAALRMCSFINSEQSGHPFSINVFVMVPRALKILCEMFLPAHMQREHSQDHLRSGNH